MRSILLALHVAGGAAGLLLGPWAVAARRRPSLHRRVGLAYQAAAAALCATAVGLAALDPTQWWLGAIGLATEGAALAGWRLARRRPRGWRSVHLQLMCGSYLSFVTGFLVVQTGSPLAWVVPTVVGSPLIARGAAGARRRDAARQAEPAPGPRLGADVGPPRPVAGTGAGRRRAEGAAPVARAR